MIRRVTEREIAILQYLAVYKFLTRTHFMKLLHLKNRNQVQLALDRLRTGKKAFVASTDKMVVAGVGSFEQFHFLTKRGAEFVISELGIKEPKYPVVPNRKPTQDHNHKKQTLNIEIAINSAFPVDFGDRYFDHVGSQRSDGTLAPKTKIIFNRQGQTLRSDLIFGMSERLYCVEIHMGKDTLKGMEQIDQYAQAITLGNPAIQYGYKYDARVLWVFEHKSCMEALMQRTLETKKYDLFAEHFLFQTLEDFNPVRWVNLKGIDVMLHP